MKKTVWTLDINFSPEITALTFPLFEKYAAKIGADFKVIIARKFLDLPVACEKLQLHELGARRDWNIFFDADTLVHPDMFDVTEYLDKGTVMHYSTDIAGTRFKLDDYFRRDGRALGSANWFTVASNWCLDLWHPLDDMSHAVAVSQITPGVREALNGGFTAEHLFDDYILSRNIARYGLKVESFVSLLKRIASGCEYVSPDGFLWHSHMFKTPEDKLREMYRKLYIWGVLENFPEWLLQEVERNAMLRL